MATTGIRARFALLTIGRLLIGAGALFRGVEAIRSMSSTNSSVLPLGFLIVGLALLWWGVVGVRAFFSKDPLMQAQMALDVDDMDRRAPSGLKPLWIGIAVAIGLVIVICLFAELVSAT
jgi:hypothetical protein